MDINRSQNINKAILILLIWYLYLYDVLKIKMFKRKKKQSFIQVQQLTMPKVVLTSEQIIFS